MRCWLLTLATAGCTSLSGLDDLEFRQPSSGPSGGSGGTGQGGGGAGGSAGGDGGGCAADLEIDPENCGGCGWSCLGGDCVAGRCDPFTLATRQAGVYDLEVHAGEVFWVVSGTGAVYACATTGCDAMPRLVGEATMGSYYLGVTDAWVFWNNNSNNQIWRCPIAGCPAGSDTPFIAGTQSPTQIGVDATHVYWHSNGGALHRAAHGGGAPEEIITGVGNHGDIQAIGAALYWTSRGGDNVAMCSDMAACDATRTVLAQGIGDVTRFAFDAGYVYYGTEQGSADIIERLPLGGGPPERIADNRQAISGIAVNDSHVYWTENEGDMVARRAKDGSGTIAVLGSYDGPSDIDVHDGFAYVTVLGTGEVVRLSW
jgi:hypothetical protein